MAATWSWTNIRAGLVTALSAVSDIRVEDHLSDSPNPPSILIGPRSIDYFKAMGPGVSTITFTLVLLAGASTERVAQIRLDRHLDPSGQYSLVAALLADPTLGGAASDTILDELDEGSYGRIAWAGTEWWGATFTGRVMAQ